MTLDGQIMRARRYYVYAVQLAPEAARTAAHRRAIAGGAHAYYVGQTGVSSGGRLLAHLRGGRGTSRVVRDHAVRLVGRDGPFRSRREAEEVERRWADLLRRVGHVVFGGR